MSPKQKVSFINKQGKRVVFWASKQVVKQTDRAAKYGARKISAYGKKKVPYKPYKTPAQRKAAQRKGAAKPSASKKVTFDYLLCPVGNCRGRFKTENAMLKHIKTAHPKYWQRVLYIRAKVAKAK